MNDTSQQLKRRPEARALSVEKLLELVTEGKVRTPAFQRPLRWQSSHVIDLFDSIYRGFPIGELLFSKKRADSEELAFGERMVSAPEVPDAYWVVDGQQRVVALVGALLHPEPVPRTGRYAVWFDLEEQCFTRPAETTPPSHWVPLNVVADSFQLLNWLNAWPLQKEAPDLVQRAIALGKAIREYQIPIYIVEEAPEDVLRLIFKRINTAGIPMKEAEVFGALYATRGHALREACRRLATTTGFGEISEEKFLRCIKAVQGADLRRQLTEHDDLLGPESVDRTEAALKRTFTFLIESAGIPHQQMLPYTLPLPVLATFFDRHPVVTSRNAALLRAWIWRGAVSKRHTDSSQATLARLLGSIDADQSASVQRLLSDLPGDWSNPSSTERWYGGAANTRLLALALLNQKPRDPRTGTPYDTQAIQEFFQERREIGRVFQRAVHGSSDSIAGRVFAPDAESLRSLREAPPEILASHIIPETAHAALVSGDASAFASSRAQALDAQCGRFFDERTSKFENLRPTITTIVGALANDERR